VETEYDLHILAHAINKPNVVIRTRFIPRVGDRLLLQVWGDIGVPRVTDVSYEEEVKGVFTIYVKVA
jgi:hypothetical protein